MLLFLLSPFGVVVDETGVVDFGAKELDDVDELVVFVVVEVDETPKKKCFQYSFNLRSYRLVY